MSCRYACLRVPAFSVAAVLRSDPGLRDRPLAIIRGRAPAVAVLAANHAAQHGGVHPGLTGAEAVARMPDLTVRAQSVSAERSAHAALLDVALGVSPRLEEIAPGTVVIEIHQALQARNERRLTEDLRASAEALGLPVAVAVASTRTAARLAARVRHVSIIPEGHERSCLAPWPLTLLDPSPETQVILTRWGITTVGALAALPAGGLIERLGDEGRRLQRLAIGEDLAPFIPYRPLSRFEEAMDLEWPIERLDTLGFALAAMMDRLLARLTQRGWAVGALDLTVGLADQTSREYAVAVAVPLSEGRAIVPLLLHRVEAAPPAAAIERLAICARPEVTGATQQGLFVPSPPPPRELAATLARIEAMVGPGRVGNPALLDSHHPEAFRLHSFGEDRENGHRKSAPAFSTRSPVLRRFRPPLEVGVETGSNGEPQRVAGERVSGTVRLAAGPWRMAGDWWADTAWSREEWDVEIGRRLVRLVFDRTTRRWFVEGTYD